MAKSIYSERNQKFRKMLTAERKKAGLSQLALAERLETHQTFVSKYELGERRLDVIEFLDIAKAIGFDAIEFIKKLK